MRVPLLDLKPQYKALKKELDEALIRVAESQYFIMGPEIDAMEKNFTEYLKCKYAIGVSSGTDALLLALMALDIKPGDEVIVPTYSFFATAGVVSRLNAISVFVDIDPVTFNIDPSKIEAKITKKTKAIIPVHLYGQSAEMDAITEIAKRNNLFVIEDAAQAIGTQYKDGRFVGTIGDIGCFSFFPSKNLGCFGDGGLVVTNNDDLGETLRIKRVHGAEPKYYHKVIGGNFRLDAIQAAVVNVKLPHLQSWTDKRKKNAMLYTESFINAGVAEETGRTSFSQKNKILLPAPVYKQFDEVDNYHIYNQYIVRVEERDELRKFLSDNQVATEIYYPVPFHKQECFKHLDSSKDKYPMSDLAASTSLALPIYPELADDQIKYVAEKITEFLRKK